MDNADVRSAITSVCDATKYLLLSKNEKYGNSALDPIRIFSKMDSVEQLLVRIDDKLSRIGRGAGLSSSDEDTVNDLIGYLVLLKVAWQVHPEHLKASQFSVDSWDGETIEPTYGDSHSNLASFYSTGDRFS